MPDDNLRDHGYPDMGEKPIGIPKATATDSDMPCPNCKCQLMQIEVAMKNPMLKGGKGIGIYLGCPACTFASPMMTRAG